MRPPLATRAHVDGVSWSAPGVLGVIAAGGAIGGTARYAVGAAWRHPPGGIPWSTFVVNAVGCFAIGLLLVALTEVAGRPHPLARPFLGTGVLGGFTTFSTYAVEAERLVAHGALGRAAGYVVGTLVVALLAAQAGVWSARAAATRGVRGEWRSRRPRRATGGGAGAGAEAAVTQKDAGREKRAPMRRSRR